MIKEFKEFALRGNVVDLAVAVVLGGAFGVVITSLVENVLTPIIAAIFGQPDFSALAIDIGDAQITYGAFLNAVMAFLFVALALFFFVVKPLMVLNARRAAEEAAEEEAAGPSEVDLLTEIRDALNR